MIEVDKISYQIGNFSLRELSLKLEKGEYGTLMGRTGSGKTTLIEVIIGLKPVQSGRILINDIDVTHERPAARGIGYVPQDAALFSTMTIRRHLSFALDIRKIPAKQVEERVNELADWLGITSLLDRYPIGLSGGERQRVAIGRALSFHPSILLLDEPLSAVDEETRGEMYELLRRVHREKGVTVLHVTHNPNEADELADVQFVLRNGIIERKHL